MRRPRDYIFLFFKGLCVGATGVLQGISGGSAALLLGIYEELLFSLWAIDASAFRLVKQKKFAQAWKKINGNFLLAVLAGLLTGLLTLRLLIAHLFSNHFILVSSFFLGLVIIAALLLLRKVHRWNVVVAVSIFVGITMSYMLTRAPVFDTPDNYLTAFGSGVLVSWTFLVPGVSGAFILLIIGKYQYILASFSTLEIGVIVFTLLGAVAGTRAMVVVFGRMLRDGYDATLAFLAGMMIGSLNKLWPWREVYEYATSILGKQVPAYDNSILPWRYAALTGKDPQVFYAILMIALGVFTVVLIEKITARLKTKL